MSTRSFKTSLWSLTNNWPQKY